MERVYIADFEADGLLEDATQVWCGVFKDVESGDVYKFSPCSTADYISSMLNFIDTRTDVLICHNGIGYDFPLLRKLYGYEYKGKKVDTLLMSRLQNPNRVSPPNCPNKQSPHSVEAWGYRFGRRKPEHEDWSRFSPEMLHRCTEDVEIQHLIYKALLEEGKGHHWRDAHMMTAKLFERLQLSEEYGWLVDQPHMNKCITTLNRWMGYIDKAVGPYLPLRVVVEEIKKKGEYSHVAKPFKKDGTFSNSVVSWGIGNYSEVLPCYVSGPFSRISFRHTDLDSNKETKEFLLSEGWEPKEWNEKNGERTSPKLSKDDPFEGVNKGVGRLVARRVQCRHRRSTIVGWDFLVRKDGRLSSSVSGLAVTGRAKHRNIVNVPRAGSFFGKHMRQIFTSQPGWVLVGTDSDGNQVRQLAARMGDASYMDTVVNGDSSKGTDIHSVNQKAAGLNTRADAKTFFYGIIFGAGDGKTGKIIRGSAAQGAELKKKFFANLPALPILLEQLTKEWKSHAKQHWNARWNRMEYADGWVKGIDGRPIYIEHEHTILVYILQSDEAIQMSLAYLKFHADMTKAGYIWAKDYGTVCWYHDEFNVECREEIAADVARIAEASIPWAGNFLGIKCPHKGNAKIGKTWYDVH